MKFDGITLKNLRHEIDDALAAVGTKHGIVLRAASASYARDGQTAGFKLELSVPTADGTTDVKSIRAAGDWPVYAKSFGLKPEWLGRTVINKGARLTIIGLMVSRSKFPVLVRDEAGKELLLTVEGVSAKLIREDEQKAKVAA